MGSLKSKIKENLDYYHEKFVSHAAESDLKKVKAFLNTGEIDINFQNKNGMTALMYSAKNNDLLMALYLIQNGANPTLLNIRGADVLQFTKNNTIIDIIERKIKHITDKDLSSNFQREDSTLEFEKIVLSKDQNSLSSSIYIEKTPITKVKTEQGRINKLDTFSRAKTKLVAKLELEDTFMSYDLKLLKTCIDLGIQKQKKDNDFNYPEFKTIFARPDKNDVVSITKDSRDKYSTGLTLDEENQVLVARTNKPQQALRTEKHELMHYFLNVLIRDGREESVAKKEELLEKYKHVFYKNADWINSKENKERFEEDKSPVFKYVKNELIGRVTATQTDYNDELDKIEEYLVEIPALQLYVDQHKHTHPEFEKHLKEIIGDMLNWYKKNIVPEMENFIKNNMKYAEEHVPKEIKDRLISRKRKDINENQKEPNIHKINATSNNKQKKSKIQKGIDKSL